MSFSNILKVISQQMENDDQGVELDRLIGEKIQAIDDLRKEKDSIEMTYAIFKMEHFTHSVNLKHVLYRKRYSDMLETKLDALLAATLKLSFTLDRIPWHKLLNYDEVVNAERKKDDLRIQNEMKEVYLKMESRKNVVELRQEQFVKTKVLSLREEYKQNAVKLRRFSQMKTEAVTRNRNEYILELVKGAKEVQQLHLKIEQQKTGAKTKQRDVQLLETGMASFNLNESLLDFSENFSSQPAKSSASEQKTRTLTKFESLEKTLKFAFHDLRYEEFDFENVEENPKSATSFGSDCNIAMPSSFCHDLMRNEENRSNRNVEVIQNIEILSAKRGMAKKREEQDDSSGLFLSNVTSSNVKEANKIFSPSIENSLLESLLVDENRNNSDIEEEQREEEETPMCQNKEEQEKLIHSFKRKMDIQFNAPSTSVTKNETLSYQEVKGRNNNPKRQKDGEEAPMNSSKDHESISFAMNMFENWSPGIESDGNSKALMFSDHEDRSGFSDTSSQDSQEDGQKVGSGRTKQKDIF